MNVDAQKIRPVELHLAEDHGGIQAMETETGTVSAEELSVFAEGLGAAAANGREIDWHADRSIFSGGSLSAGALALARAKERAELSRIGVSEAESEAWVRAQELLRHFWRALPTAPSRARALRTALRELRPSLASPALASAARAADAALMHADKTLGS